MPRSRADRHAPPIHVGTSGWNYPEFEGRLYPPGLPQARRLEFYAGVFGAVELNASFYRSFPAKTWEGWARRTPPGFLWAVKVHRYLTHVRRLEVEPDSARRIWADPAPLGEKLAVALVQLPPDLPFDPDRLGRFLDLAAGGGRLALEARHSSWHAPAAWRCLEARNVAWVVADTAGRYPMSVRVTADFAYVRLHGAEGLYRGRYGDERLGAWLETIRSWGVETFCFFDNTASGDAASDALRMAELAGRRLPPPFAGT
ncbi:DUF72 domain-containing protein [Dissulfurirhabdus thermomarina]|uniref:DUF72 domain-containing protein n=1 Tax=Dissulfurirhabdus thermomarina TaxID=1765737 RepID=A0A6N9TWU6_DISTH|nr:DUF72 domain-containing protein [Dissulfurirhabdus thermomarina]NDY42956.1 DUF72 domain-containing protein [Dissulfurirhabdus thermomarina]NMX24330.1 DUF72 domain-containing protein [Dissulfurirhabdus thermomarina]